VVNNYEMPTGDFTRDADAFLPADAMAARLAEAVPAGQSCQMNATGLATSLLGDAIASNLFLLGVAWQRGLVPLSRESMREAIRLNGVAIDQSLQAFDWGRRWVVDEHSVMHAAGLTGMHIHKPIDDINELIADRMSRLTAYQNAAYADRFKAKIEMVRACDTDTQSTLTKAAARGLYKMMAMKDEYEVARLYTDGMFATALKKQFDGDISLSFHLAPPVLSGIDAVTGRPVKRRFGGWMMWVMRGLAKMKGLRGGMFDIFGYTQERRGERVFLARYESLLDRVCSDITLDNCDIAVSLASIPDDVRGFGPVRERHMQMAGRQIDVLLEQFSSASALKVKN
jgi:indolepyruvate ferredoxin oxidoreductase